MTPHNKEKDVTKTKETEETLSPKEQLDALLVQQALERREVASRLLGPIIEKIVARTAAWAEESGYTAVPPTGVSERAAGVSEFLCGTDFGCYGAQVRGLCSALLGEKLPEVPFSALVTYLRGVVVVPVKQNSGAHNYALDKPAVFMGYGGVCYSEKHRVGTGNCMTNMKAFLRPATPGEITELLTALVISKEEKVVEFVLGLVD